MSAAPGRHRRSGGSRWCRPWVLGLAAALSACGSSGAPGTGGAPRNDAAAADSADVPAEAPTPPPDANAAADRLPGDPPLPPLDGAEADTIVLSDAAATGSDLASDRPAAPDAPAEPPADARQPDATSDAAGPVACNTAPVADPFYVSLAGAWDFTPQGGALTKIQVPGGGWVKQGFTAPTATYRTTIAVPDLGAPQTTLLEFGAINHEATLTVDGMMVGTNMTAFTPSVFDITKFVVPGQSHVISLLVRGRDALRNTAGKRTVPAAADWSAYVPQGIYRSAMLRVIPSVYVSDVFVRANVSGNSIAYDVSLTNSGATPRQVTLQGSLDSWNCEALAYPALPSSTVTVAAGTTQKVTVGPVTWGLPPSSNWWPNVPYQPSYLAKLHNLRVRISDGAQVVHEKVVRFGYRDTQQTAVDAQHAYYFLNGVRVNFRGDSLQGVDYDSINNGGFGDAYDTLPGFLPPSAQNPGWPQAVRNYQRLNYNVVRIHQELASPYMLDVADELGLMLIDETAIRGTDGQDFVLGHDNMVNHARAMVLRDRNHPAVIRWSQSNEENISPTDSIQFAGDLYNAIAALDPTRPVSADVSGSNRAYDAIVHPNFSVYGHYLNGLGLYTDEVAARPDRPFGQGEFIWPNDVTRQGLMWFATATMAMRVKNASEIRPYTLLSGWASVIPGVTTTMMRLEPTYPAGIVNPPLFGENNLPDPWSNSIIMRVQRAYNPLLVADQAYWEANKMSNANGDWPVVLPALARNADSDRLLVVFNDAFAGTAVDVAWEVRADSATGAVASSGMFTVTVPLGSFASHLTTIHTPAAGTRCVLVLRAQKGGVAVFEDTAQAFTLN